MRQCYAKIQYRTMGDPEVYIWLDLAYFVFYSDAKVACEAFKAEPAFKWCVFRVVEMNTDGE